MSDERVEAAIKNWAPRFTSQGVDYNDFFRTTARVEKWEDWCREWVATGNVHHDIAVKAETRSNTVSAGEAYIGAALCYHFGKFVFQDYHDEYMSAANKSVQAFANGLKLLDPTGERVEIPFDGAVMVGTLRRPAGVKKPPLVLLLPGLDSTKEEFFYWENVFLKRGLATFSLDGPGQGECGYNSHIRPDYEAAVSTVLDTLTKRKDIDVKRIGLAGVSLGGYYAPRAAAFEPRVKAAVGNCGPWNFAECWHVLPSLTRAAFQHHSGAKNEEEAIANANKLSLDGVAQKIKQPLLVIQGRLDRLIPWEQAVKIVNAVGSNAELAMFENGNHVCNNIPYVYRPLTADWLKEKLG
ncbi:MAG TPA: alpha/beta fold hydrolase [Anaerolineales bacterium]|nr:alpha/beta fold hydrolase [Anaerolineales bacterium]